MDQPVRGESVSEGEEGLVWRGRKTQAVLWHRLHLHSSAGSRWTDGRIDGQTEWGEEGGETHKHRYSQGLLHCLLLRQCRCKRKGRLPEDEKQTNSIKQSDVKERVEIRPKLHSTDEAGSRTDGQSDSDRKASLQSAQRKQRRREKEKPECSQHSCRRTSGDAGLETVSNKTQPKTLCRAEKPHAP